MGEAKMVSPPSRWKRIGSRLLLALNSGLFVWALVARMQWGDTPEHSTGFVFLTGALCAQSLCEFVSSSRARGGLLIAASVLIAVALALIAR
ncbi:MAG: hypothetical protein IPK85_09140 [Gemmatimonadetes bacterium]|nr:hypothetical protein [Gemmatimonadota bacterium]